MRAYLDKHADRAKVPDFDAPGNIVFVPVEGGGMEAYIKGTEPQETALPAQPPAADLRGRPRTPEQGLAVTSTPDTRRRF
jgi:hypothetical protein